MVMLIAWGQQIHIDMSMALMCIYWILTNSWKAKCSVSPQLHVLLWQHERKNGSLSLWLKRFHWLTIGSRTLKSMILVCHWPFLLAGCGTRLKCLQSQCGNLWSSPAHSWDSTWEMWRKDGKHNVDFRSKQDKRLKFELEYYWCRICDQYCILTM